jgi:hypothetical protein
VFHDSHGDIGFMQVNEDMITVKDLNEALKHAQKKKLFKELTYYIGVGKFDSQRGYLNKETMF